MLDVRWRSSRYKIVCGNSPPQPISYTHVTHVHNTLTTCAQHSTHTQHIHAYTHTRTHVHKHTQTPMYTLTHPMHYEVTRSLTVWMITYCDPARSCDRPNGVDMFETPSVCNQCIWVSALLGTSRYDQWLHEGLGIAYCETQAPVAQYSGRRAWYSHSCAVL